MTARATMRWKNGLAAVAMVAVLTGVGMGACGGEDTRQRGTGVGSTGGPGGGSLGGGTATGRCEGDEIRECKVQIDANNCFVGEQQCQDGEWGPCVDPEKLDTAALGAQADCVNNPCNPWCQQYDEDPNPDLQAAGTPAPAGGPIQGLPSSWRGAGQVEPCSQVGDCQFDTYCDTNMTSPSYQQCVPWGWNSFDAANNTGPDFTVPVQCDSGFVKICNRANYTVPPGTDVEVVTFSASPSNFGTCNDFSGSAHDTCVWSGGMAPGQCVNVTGCNMAGTKTIYVNPPMPPGTLATSPLAETSTVPGPACENNWSVYHPSSACACSGTSTSGSLQNVYMYIMFDSSISMGSGAGSLLENAKSAVSTFVNDPGSAYLNVAFRTYGFHNGEDCERFSCNELFCDQPIVDYGSLSSAAHRTSLTTAISAVANIDDTPHLAALGGACLWSENHAMAFPTDKHVVVYISDGNFTASCGTTMTISQQAADAFANQGVETYAVALPGADTALLGAIATAGNTALVNLTSSGDVNADLTAALQVIAGSLASCSITVPNAGQVDFSNISVEYWPMGNMGAAIGLVEVANVGACSGAANEFYVSGTTVELCGATCTTVQGDPTGVVNVLGGCIGGYLPASTTFTYQGDCTSFPGAGPVWEFLTYDNDVPGDATVVFEMRTGNTAAEASMGAWTTVSTATSGSPDATFGGGTEVDLAAALGPLAQQEFMELRITRNPTSSGSATPIVYDWDLQFSCLNNE